MNARWLSPYALALALAAVGATTVGWTAPGRPGEVPAYAQAYAVRFDVLSQSSRQELQVRLADRGYYDGPIDGHISPVAREALSQFQQDRGLPATGLLDAHTAWALGLDVYVAVDEAEALAAPL